MTDTISEQDQVAQPLPSDDGKEKTSEALERLKSEARAITDRPRAERTKVHLAGRAGEADLFVEQLLDWGDDWQERLRDDDMRGWARAVLDADELDKWIECAPTIRQAVAFYHAWAEAIGSDAGESSAS